MNTPMIKFSLTTKIENNIAASGLTRTQVITEAMRAAVKHPNLLLTGLSSRLENGDSSPLAPQATVRVEPALAQAFKDAVERLGLPIGAVINLAIEGYLATRQPVNSTV